MNSFTLSYLSLAVFFSSLISISADDTNVNYQKLCEEYRKETESIYGKIKNIESPSEKELAFLQDYLNNGKREYLLWLDTFYPDCRNDHLRLDRRVRNIKLIRDKEKPSYYPTPYYIGAKRKDKKQCIICYTSFNQNFVTKIKKMPKLLAKIGYEGHFLSRIGVWPDLEGGSIKLAHVPYAFKVSMLNEARRLGYKNVLWLDSSFIPLTDLSEIFDLIEKNGYFATCLPYSLHSHGSEMMRESLGLTEKEMFQVKQCAGGLVGINFEHPSGITLFNAWYKAAEDLGPFLSPL